MKTFPTRLLAILLACLCTLAAQAAQTETAPASALPLAPAVRHGTLPNGLSYYILPNRIPANKVEMRLVVRAGSVLEDEDQRGLAHFVEHMAFNGSTHFRKHELVSFMQTIGVKFGADLNASTGFDQTVYILPIPTDKKENFEKGIEVLEDWAGGLSFDNDEIERERGVVLEESRRRKGAAERMDRVTRPHIYAGSPYATHLPIGSDEVIRTFRPETLKRFYADWYRPDLMAVILVGDLDAQQAEQMVIRHFSALKNPSAERARPYPRVPPRETDDAVVVSDAEAGANQLRIYYARTFEADDATLAGLRRRLVRTLFNQLLGRRVGGQAQTAGAPYLSGASGISRLADGSLHLVSSATVADSGAAAAIGGLIAENRRAAQFGFAPQELERVKKIELNNLEHRYNERDKTSSAAYVAALIGHFTQGEPVLAIEDELAYARQLLPGISVEEMNAFAATTLAPDHKVMVYQAVDKGGVFTPAPRDVLEMADLAARTPVHARVEKLLPAALMARAPEGGAIVEERSDSALGLTELTLANGIHVTLKQTAFQNDQVLMTALRAGGLSLYPDRDFIAAGLAPTIVKAMGAGPYSPSDLAKILAGKSVSVTPFILPLYEGISGQSGSADVEAMLQLSYLYFTAPRRDPALFEAFIAAREHAAKNAVAQPEVAFQETVYKALYGGHPRAPHILTAADYGTFEADHALALYRQRFASARDYRFIFVGSFDLARMKALAAGYLGALPAAPVETAFRDTGLRPVGGVVTQRQHIGIEQKSMIALTFNGQAAFSADAALRLQALLEVLRIKLLERLRGDMGTIYSLGVGGGLSAQPYGHYTITLSIPCAPENVERVLAAALGEMQALRSDGPQLADLDKVRLALLKTYREGMRNNSYWLRSLTESFETGQDPHRLLAYESRLAALRPADLKASAQDCFDTHNYVQAVLYPVEKTAAQ